MESLASMMFISLSPGSDCPIPFSPFCQVSQLRRFSSLETSPVGSHVTLNRPPEPPQGLEQEEHEFAGKYGQLTPTGGGDPIPLVKERLLIGRRGEADIQLKFNNVSTQHCRLTLEHGYWFVRDLNSRNGTKVDGRSVIRKRVDPESKLSIARHEYVVEYDPQALGAYGPPPADDDYMDEMMRSSLMDRAGLKKRDRQRDSGKSRRMTLDDPTKKKK